MQKVVRFGICACAFLFNTFASAGTVVETAVADGNFKTLAAALTKANLIDTLSGTGPFTVFAPTDAAFEAALAALGITAEELLARADLGDILKYHVASGKTLSSDLSNGMKVTSLQDKPNLAKELTVAIDGATVTVNGATVTSADLGCSNGVIHVIDKVVLPANLNVVETAIAAGSFKTLAAALTKAKLVDALSGTGPFTVFAPTDAAFEAALTELKITAEDLLARKDLEDILKYHVASGKTMSTALSSGTKVATLQGDMVTVTIEGATVKVNDATVIMADVETSNGVVHVIDKVLLPTSKTETAKKDKGDASAAAPFSRTWSVCAAIFGIFSCLISA